MVRTMDHNRDVHVHDRHIRAIIQWYRGQAQSALPSVTS